MIYCVLHYEKNNKIYEYTLQASTKSLLQDIVAQAIEKLTYFGRCKKFYFNSEEAMLSFERGIFRF